jgi:hypothetical protein
VVTEVLQVFGVVGAFCLKRFGRFVNFMYFCSAPVGGGVITISYVEEAL